MTVCNLSSSRNRAVQLAWNERTRIRNAEQRKPEHVRYRKRFHALMDSLPDEPGMCRCTTEPEPGGPVVDRLWIAVAAWRFER